MRVVVNGKQRDVPDRATVAQLIESLGMTSRRVVVEHNGEAVERTRFAQIVLQTGDVLEVVRAVQGG